MSKINTAGWAAAGMFVGHKIGQSIGNHFAKKRTLESLNEIHAELSEKYGPVISDEVIARARDMINQGGGADIASLLEDIFQKRMYKITFSLYGEDAADFVLAKWNKYVQMELDFNPDDALADFISKNPNSDIAVDGSLALKVFGVDGNEVSGEGVTAPKKSVAQMNESELVTLLMRHKFKVVDKKSAFTGETVFLIEHEESWTPVKAKGLDGLRDYVLNRSSKLGVS